MDVMDAVRMLQNQYGIRCQKISFECKNSFKFGIIKYRDMTTMDEFLVPVFLIGLSIGFVIGGLVVFILK